VTRSDTAWLRELVAGLSAACITLPFGLAAGVLVYSPLGPDFVALGTVAGLITVVVAGAVAALAASSGFIITSANASTGIIPAALATYLMGEPAFAAHPAWIVLAIALCVLLGGLLQVAFGLLDVGRIIKFTPHSVIAGFISSVGLLTMLSPLRPLFALDLRQPPWIIIERPAMLLFILLSGAAIYVCGKRWPKIPVHLAGLAITSLAYYAIGLAAPGLDLGRTIGTLPIAFPPSSPLPLLADATAREALWSVAPHLLLTSLTIGAVVSLQALLVFRVTQNLADSPPRPPRDLIGQGLGNCASALAGGFVAVAVGSPTNAAFRLGGRTRLTGLFAAASIFVAAFLLSPVLGRIPIVALSAVLVASGLQLLDPWALRLPGELMRSQAGIDRRHTAQSLIVVAAVMILSVVNSIIAGAIAGFVLSCLIFIVNMSRPIVRRRYEGDRIFSKRIRSSNDMTTLLRTGAERAVLELQGVLFFGNADDLSNLVAELLKQSRMVLLDLRGISDVDVSGVSILANMATRAKSRGRSVLFCHVPADRSASLAASARVFADLDSALEWMEEESLHGAGARPAEECIPLAELDFTRELSADDLRMLETALVARDFAPGSVICEEGGDGDRMWLLTRGTVSVRLEGEGGTRRIASVAAGTTVGEMAILEGSRRLATVTADGEVSTYELSREAFETILREHPPLGQKLLSYFAREMTRRLRLLHRDLRSAG
jgi:MFS superfamily sulfate permease-like transporter